MVIPGLIITDQQVASALASREISPFDAAWRVFDALATDPAVQSDPLLRLTNHSLRWRLSGDSEEAERAIAGFSGISGDDTFSAGRANIDASRRIFALAQAASCFSGHPAFSAAPQANLNEFLMQAVAALSGLDDSGIHERAWQTLAELSVGIVSGHPAQVEAAVEAFREIVRQILPHGYILSLVEAKDPDSLTRVVETVQALVLTAEVGQHAGLGLWDYEVRGVSVMTAALYPLYYYYYPEKWPWAVDSPFQLGRKLSRRERKSLSAGVVVLEPTQSIFKQHGSFLELVNRHTETPVRAVTMILDELRPIVDLLGGGPVTLTHAPAPPPKRRGLFGR